MTFLENQMSSKINENAESLADYLSVVPKHSSYAYIVAINPCMTKPVIRAIRAKLCTWRDNPRF